MKLYARSYVALKDTGSIALICFPWSGAGALPFRSWAATAPDDIALLVARHGGREDRVREPAPVDIPSLVAQLTDDLPADRPFVLFGHCLGALLAFEVARELRRRRFPAPHHLLVVGNSPALSTGQPPVTDIREAVRQSGAVRPDILDDPDIFPLFEPTLAADFRLAASYVHTPESPLDIPIVAYAPSSSPAAEHDAASDWAAETAKDFALRILAGDKLFPHDVWQPLADEVFALAARAGKKDGIRP